MSTGITIRNASYGVGSTTTDVTGILSQKVVDGAISLTVSPSALGVQDPAPGQTKTLNVIYIINNGRENVASFTDGQALFINAPPERDATGLQILKAQYGYAGNNQDVTDAMNKLVNDGNISLTVGFKALGIPDPNPNKVKQLEVEYSINGAKNLQVIPDGQSFNLSAPSAVGSDGKNPSQHVMSFVGILFTNIARFIGVFLHTLSVVSAYRFGEVFISPWIWAALAFFIPGFSFFVLPVIIFWVRLFSGSDFAVPGSLPVLTASIPL